MDDRIDRQLNFICELDRLKSVQRQTWLMDASRKENSAEHSWQENGISRKQVHDRNRLVGQGAPALWAYIESLLDRAVEKGILRRSSQ